MDNKVKNPQPTSKRARRKQAAYKAAKMSPKKATPSNPARPNPPPPKRNHLSILTQQVQEDPEIGLFALQLANAFVTSGVPYPNARGVNVATYKMKRNVEVPLNPDGFFAVCIQPGKLGSSTDLASYQCLLVRGDAPGWTTGDWSTADNYLINDGTGDLRFDPNYSSIVATSPARRSYMDTVLAVPAAINAIALADWNNFLENQFNISITTSADGFTINFPPGPPQNYVVTVIITTNQAVNTTMGAPVVVLGGGVLSFTSVAGTRLSTTTAGNNPLYAAHVWEIVTTGAGTFRITYSGGTALTSTINAIYMDFRPVAVEAIDGGMFSSMQVVAAAGHLAFVGPTWQNAGSVACALGNVGSVRSAWLASSGTCAFRPQHWESYTQQQEGRDSRVFSQGLLKQGAFVTYRAQSEPEQSLAKPSVWNTMDTSPLFIAGRYQTTETLPPGGVLRLEYVITVQFETYNRLLTTSIPQRVYTNPYPAIENFLFMMKIPVAGANGFHEWWTALIEKAGKFFSDVGGVIGILWNKFVEGARPKLGYKTGPYSIEL